MQSALPPRHADIAVAPYGHSSSWLSAPHWKPLVSVPQSAPVYPASHEQMQLVPDCATPEAWPLQSSAMVHVLRH
jgi:hypothetical protein